MKIETSTPSRICLFGEHQDYLGLEVIACAVDLRFSASIQPNGKNRIHILIRDEKIDTLNMVNEGQYQEHWVDLQQPIVYRNNRDYLRSTVNLLLKQGYDLQGFDIVMDSQIPIGKGMCSSSTMIIVLIKALLEGIQHPDKENPERIAHLGYLAEVEEFKEPGGMMDHFTSAFGGLVHLDFADGKFAIERLEITIPGKFVLFDSLEQKKTTEVLAESKIPTLEALEILGIRSVREIDPSLLTHVEALDAFHKRKLLANVRNYEITKQALGMLKEDSFDKIRFGELLKEHHANLRDGLHISTPIIESILENAYANGALGGKVNGSGGGGCCFVYCLEDSVEQIVQSSQYPCRVLTMDRGVIRHD